MKDIVGKCKICGKEIRRDHLTATELDNTEKAVYHESFGFACLSHHGVKEHFEELLTKVN